MSLDLPVPYKSVTIKTNLSKEEIIHRLDRIVSRKYIWRQKNRDDKEFYGTIQNDKIKIARYVQGRNSYLPRITGVIERKTDGTYLSLKMKLHPLVILVMLFLLMQPFFLSYTKNGNTNFMWSVIVIAFHVLMYYIGFLPETKRAEERLIQLLS